MTTLLFGSLPGPELSLDSASPFIDGVELRLDTFETIDLNAVKTFLQQSNMPVMITLRRGDQGGSFKGAEEERLKLLSALCALKPAYLDLEYDIPQEFRKKLFEDFPEVQIINSYHNFVETPADLDALYQKIYTPFAHLTKIAVTAQSTADALRMLSFLRRRNEKIIGISMGEEGKITRILAPLLNAPLTYAALELSTAPGQLTCNELQETYHFRSLNQQTEIYALIGDPVEKSLGAIVHNRAFRERGRNAVYVKIPLKMQELAPFFKWTEEFAVRGLSVTMPHKENVLPFLTERSEGVEHIGACNTIKIDGRRRCGFNTDGAGALDAIEKIEKVKGRHALVIGAGGASKAIIDELLRRGAQVTILNRTAERARALAEHFHCEGGGFDRFKEYDILINCTPNSSIIPDEWILPGKVLMDTVYVPRETSFLLRGAKKNCRLVFGDEMFFNQAAAQQSIWLD